MSFIHKWAPFGTLESWMFEDKELIIPWGIEFADTSGFFSLSEAGWRVQKEIVKQEISPAASVQTLLVQLPQGKFELRTQEKCTKNQVERVATLTTLTTASLMDFVQCYRFRKDVFPYAEINEQVFSHQNTNVYHQYPVRSLRLFNDTEQITVRMTSKSRLMQPVMYVRDSKAGWMVHCRLLPTTPAHKILKLNTWWYNKAVPLSLSNLLWAIPGFEKMVWYRSERAPYSRWNPLLKFGLSPNGYLLQHLEKGERMELHSVAQMERIHRG